jgi:hypothetical protein
MVKVRSSIKVLEIEWPNGKKDLYRFNIGDKDALASWQAKHKSLDGYTNRITDENAIEELYKIESELIAVILGEKAWREIWKKCENNVFAGFDIVTELSRLVKTGLEDAVKTMKPNA